MQQINAFVLGHGLQKGVAVWIGFEEADRLLGAIARRPFASTKGGAARSRVRYAPAWQLHAPKQRRQEANAGELAQRRLESAVTGYAVWHPFATLGAGTHQTFWAEFSSPLPERHRPVHAAYALAMYELGCRGEDPAKFNYWRHAI